MSCSEGYLNFCPVFWTSPITLRLSDSLHNYSANDHEKFSKLTSKKRRSWYINNYAYTLGSKHKPLNLIIKLNSISLRWITIRIIGAAAANESFAMIVVCGDEVSMIAMIKFVQSTICKQFRVGGVGKSSSKKRCPKPTCCHRWDTNQQNHNNILFTKILRLPGIIIIIIISHQYY